MLSCLFDKINHLYKGRKLQKWLLPHLLFSRLQNKRVIKLGSKQFNTTKATWKSTKVIDWCATAHWSTENRQLLMTLSQPPHAKNEKDWHFTSGLYTLDKNQSTCPWEKHDWVKTNLDYYHYNCKNNFCNLCQKVHADRTELKLPINLRHED